MAPATLIILLVVLATSLVAFTLVHNARARRDRLEARAKHIARYRFPAELERRLATLHPRLSPPQRELVFEGLRQYFLACLAAKGGGVATRVGMPSRVVDDAWHEFILMTRDYAKFCQDAFGAYLHHSPKGRMDVPMRDALANTLHQFGKAPLPGTAWAVAAGVPLLFALDRELGIEGGYTHDAGTVGELQAHRQALLVQSGGGEIMFDGFDDDSGGGDGGGGDGGGCGGGCGD